MDYPFNNKMRYFSDAEKKHLDKFLENEPKTGTIYENGKGEKRLVLKVAYPKGIITKETVYWPEMLVDGSKYFHTPRAKCAGVEGIVTCEEDGKQFNVTSKEWLKWVATVKSTEQKPKPEQPAFIEARRKMLGAMEDVGVDTKEKYDEQKKEDFVISKRSKKKK
jgi:hypothetical protein